MLSPDCTSQTNAFTYHLVNLGCKVNRVEADRIEFDLMAHGFQTGTADAAEVIIINTCAVTGEAETKARKAVRQASRQPQAPWVVVTGCAASLHHDVYAALGPRVLISTDKERILETVLDLLGISNSRALQAPCAEDGSAHSSIANRRLGIKVQDGCNNRCTYCIVWKARGPARSIRVETVLDRVREAVSLGVHEIVLTGINLGSYQDRSCSLAGLVRKILTSTSIARIRLSSIEPLDITPELIEVMRTFNTRIAKHIHIPLQAGSDRILQAMDRNYTVEQFVDRVDALRSALPSIALSTDIICGFPGESNDDFEKTLAISRYCKFAKIHVFRFSARPDTPAAAMSDQIAPQIIADRARQLRSLSLELRIQDGASRLDTSEYVLVEALSPSVQGTSDSYHRVQIVDAFDETGQARVSQGDLVKVRFSSIDSTGLLSATLIPGE